MEIATKGALVTGGASGLGRAAAAALAARGAIVTIVDLPASDGEAAAAALGAHVAFVAADITDADSVAAAVEFAAARAPLRAAVHCAGRVAALRVVDRAGNPGSLDVFASIVNVNLVGTFNVLSHAAAAMARLEPDGSERGVIVTTASIAGIEGQIGQAPYAASKAGVIGLTITAARDLAARGIRVNSIAPGVFQTPMMAAVGDEVAASLAASVPFPPRLGDPAEFAALACHLIENQYLNGETIRLDGALRLPPR
ncbi:MAG TPA: SDR family NAD(P)-dependent oxidoreductase [Candidatus Lumbricidophila sp.]|nr:SDR family NAD(P)-dependent oxidoreductase [Candidatus Lumbricidophila sp.]